MVATWKESVEVLVDLFKSDWLRANTNNIQPVIIDIADDRGERGKRLDLGRHDYQRHCGYTNHKKPHPFTEDGKRNSTCYSCKT